MMGIDMFAKIKKFYNRKLWTKEQVHYAVGIAIDEAEYKEITGEDYVA